MIVILRIVPYLRTSLFSWKCEIEEMEPSARNRVESMIQEFKEKFEATDAAESRKKSKQECPINGQVCYKKGDYEGALENFAKHLAAALVDSTDDHEMKASLSANIASCLHMLGEFDDAKASTRVSLPVWEVLKYHLYEIVVPSEQRVVVTRERANQRRP